MKCVVHVFTQLIL